MLALQVQATTFGFLCTTHYLLTIKLLFLFTFICLITTVIFGELGLTVSKEKNPANMETRSWAQLSISGCIITLHFQLFASRASIVVLNRPATKGEWWWSYWVLRSLPAINTGQISPEWYAHLVSAAREDPSIIDTQITPSNLKLISTTIAKNPLMIGQKFFKFSNRMHARSSSKNKLPWFLHRHNPVKRSKPPWILLKYWMISQGGHTSWLSYSLYERKTANQIEALCQNTNNW